MGKFVGLVGALTTLGAMAYLMAPLPPADTVAVAPAKPPIAPQRVNVAVAPPSSTVPAPKRDAAPTVVHQIQLELQRLGCYTGSIDGRWSEPTQRAMQELGERLNVLRPVDTPDYIMLALARDQQRGVCAHGQVRAAATRPMTRVEPTAAPVRKEAEAPSARRNSRPTRVTASEPPSASRAAAPPAPSKADAPQWVAEVHPAEAARAAAAREELTRIAQRAPVIARSADELQAAQSPTEPAPAQPSKATLENSRMGLGVVDVDPLRAGIDPRDPNAPAILRGPPQPAPVATARVGGPAEPQEAAPPPRRPARAVSEPTAPPTAKQARRVWQRSIFLEMQRNGP
jgi:hypothetical protein